MLEIKNTCGESKGSYGQDSHLILVGQLTTLVWAIHCYCLSIKNSTPCSGLQGCRRAEAGGVAALRTETEMAVGQRGPEAETGLLCADLL